MDINRRRLIEKITFSFFLYASGSLRLVKPIYAMGSKVIPQGMHKIEGDVKINGIPAKPGDIVSAGDLIETGIGGSAVFVCGTSAYMMRSASRLIVQSNGHGESKIRDINVLKLLEGKLLSVFSPGIRSIETPSAYIGIRGTGIYIEADRDKSYICTCYGRVVIRSLSDPGEEENIVTRHHESPRYVYKADPADTAVGSSPSPVSVSKKTRLITTAPMLNHTDAELKMLEALVGRVPPSAASSKYKAGSGGY